MQPAVEIGGSTRQVGTAIPPGDRVLLPTRAVADVAPIAIPTPMHRGRLSWLRGLVVLRSFAVFVALWWAFAAWTHSPLLLPTPLAVFTAFEVLARDGELSRNVMISFGRLLISLGVALVLALPLGFLMGISERTRAFVDPMVELMRPISGIAWIPLGLFIFGIGGVLPVFIMTYVAFFPLLLNTIAGVRGADQKLIAAARTMGVPRAGIIRHVIVPGALPTIMVGLRMAFAGAWAAIIAAELIGSPSGLGFEIEWYRELLMSPKVFVYLIVIAMIGYVCDFGLQVLQRLLTPWTLGRELA